MSVERTPEELDGPREPVSEDSSVPGRTLAGAQLHKHDAIVGSYRRRTARKLTALSGVRITLRYLR